MVLCVEFNVLKHLALIYNTYNTFALQACKRWYRGLLRWFFKNDERCVTCKWLYIVMYATIPNTAVNEALQRPTVYQSCILRVCLLCVCVCVSV